MPARPRKVERGVYARDAAHGAVDYGSRCDELNRRGVFRWGFSTAVKARHDYQKRRTKARDARHSAGETQPTKATLRELVDDFLPTIENKHETYKDIKRRLDWWAAHFKAQPVLTLTSMQIEQAMAKLVKEGRKGATANRYGADLRHLMNKYVSPVAWVQEVWARVDFYDEHKDRPVPVLVSDDYEELLYEAMDPLDALYARLDLLIGLRRSHLFKLRWEQMHWSEGFVFLPPFKRRKARKLPLIKEAIAIMAVLHEMQGKPIEGWMFPSIKQVRNKVADGPMLIDRSRPVNAHNWYVRHYAPAVKKAGLPNGVTFHSLRRTWASRVGSRAPSRILQILGGWGSIDQVEIYCQPHEDAMREAMEQASGKCVKNVFSADQFASRKVINLIDYKTKRPRSSVG